MGKKVKHYGGGHWQVPNPAPQYANMGMTEAVRYYQAGVPIVPVHNPPAVPTDFDAAEAQEALVASGQQAPAVPAPAPAYVPLGEASTIPTGVEPSLADTGTLDQSSTGDLLSLVSSEDLSNAHVMDLTGRVDPAAEAELVRRGYVKINGRWQEGTAKAEETAQSLVNAPTAEGPSVKEKLETGQVITPEDQQNLNAAQRVRDAGAENQVVADEAATIQAAQDEQAAAAKMKADQDQENKNRIAAGLEPKVFTTDDDGTVKTGDQDTDNRVNAGKQAAAEVDDSTWDSLTDKVKGWWGKTMDFLGKEEFEGALSTTVLAYLGSRALGYDSDSSWGFARQMGLNLYSQAKQQTAANKKQFATAQAERRKAFNESQKAIQTQAAKQAGDRIKLFEQEENFQGLQQSGKWGITGSSAASDVRDFAKDLGITNAQDPAFLRAQDLALDAAKNYATTGGEKVSDLRPFLMAAYLPESAGYSAETLWGIEGTGSEEGLLTDAKPTKLADGKQIQDLTNRIKTTWSDAERKGGNSATLLSNDVYWLKQAFDRLPADKRKEYLDQSRGSGQTSAFMLFAETQLGALKKQDSTIR